MGIAMNGNADLIRQELSRSASPENAWFPMAKITNHANNPELVVGALQRLEQQLPNLRCRFLEVGEAQNSGDLRFAMRAIEGTRQALDTIAATTICLKRQVVPADGLGGTLESLGELVIRATRMVMIEQVRQLRLAISGLTARERACAAFATWSHDVSAASSFLDDRLQQIDDIWIPYRRTGPTTAVRGNRVLYRAAICVAQRAVRELGNDPGFGCFLRDRVTRMVWPVVRRAVASILAVVTLHIDIEPDCKLLVRRVPLYWCE